MLGKKGSHVGVILSFVIFIVFLVFLFSALQPALKMEKDKEATLEYITSSIIELASDNITIENIVVDNTNDDCVQIDILEPERNILVKNSEGGVFSYSVGDTILIKIPAQQKSFLKIYYSNSILQQDYSVTCTTTNINPKIGFISKEKVIFISKFKGIVDGDYNSLKKELGISEGTEFSFNLLDADKNIVVEMKTKEVSTNVYVNEFPILYSDENGEIKSGFINVKVW